MRLLLHTAFAFQTLARQFSRRTCRHTSSSRPSFSRAGLDQLRRNRRPSRHQALLPLQGTPPLLYSTLGAARQIRDASGPEGRKRARDAQHSKQAVARPAGDRAAGNNRAQWRYAAVVRSGGVVDHAKTSKHRCRTSSLPLIHDANDAAMWTPPGDPIEHRHEQMGGSGAIVTGRSALTDHPGYFQTVGTLGDVTF